jgi:hypothetical protein|nr:MAG TPA: protein of unknown function (DUF4376) [Bacteriophage sp.]
MDENEVKDATGIIGTTGSSDSSASTESEKPIVMELGYKVPKPDSPDEEAELYSKLETAVNEHNSAAQPGEYHWGISFTNSEYEIIQGEVVPEPIVPPTPVEPTIEEVREDKLNTASATCETLIYDGIDVTLSSGKKHFSLEIADQSNIDGIFNAVTLGATAYPYHADGELCTMFSASDIVLLYMSYKNFVTAQTTYCNALRQWIMREKDKDALLAIEYGATLPDDLNDEMNKILDAANKQVQAIVSKLAATVDMTE